MGGELRGGRKNSVKKVTEKLEWSERCRIQRESGGDWCRKREVGRGDV
jgi:hypothetical protein